MDVKSVSDYIEERYNSLVSYLDRGLAGKECIRDVMAQCFGVVDYFNFATHDEYFGKPLSSGKCGLQNSMLCMRGKIMSSSKIRDSSLPSTFPRDIRLLALTGLIIAVVIAIYNIL